MKKFIQLFVETAPILFGMFLSFLFWENNVLLFVLYLVLSLGIIFFHKEKAELIIFGYGIFIGALVEIIGTYVSGYQSFTNSDFFGIPMWIPIVWGYGFVAMKRIGFVLKDR